jgi:hypothetical protein
MSNPFDCYECGDEAEFWRFETWTDGVGGVEYEEPFCGECIKDAGPSQLDNADINYEFRIEAIAEAFGMRTL